MNTLIAVLGTLVLVAMLTLPAAAVARGSLAERAARKWNEEE